MPRYFFDTDDGDAFLEDDEGLELPDHEAARRAATAALPDMARDKLREDDRRTLAVQVRDANGAPLYTATLGLTGQWHVGRSGKQA